jgi:iron uptake system EfeUOB component EfeO/EfeM
MNKLVYRILTWGVLPLIIGLLVYANFHSISEPLEFNDEKARRQKVAVQRLKDIRELQDAFSTVYGRYAPTMDSLIWFYNEGKMQITRRIGSPDDSAAVANTQAVIKREKLTKLKGDKLAKALNEYYEKTGDAQLVFETKTNIFIKDNEMDEAEHIKATYSQAEIDNLDGFVACPWVMMDPDKEEVIIEQIELLGKAKAYFYSDEK